MKNLELQQLLQTYPDDMDIKLLIDHIDYSKENKPIDLTIENIMETSETAYVDDNAPEDEWDTEDSKVELGDGKRYLLFNPIII